MKCVLAVWLADIVALLGRKNSQHGSANGVGEGPSLSAEEGRLLRQVEREREGMVGDAGVPEDAVVEVVEVAVAEDGRLHAGVEGTGGGRDGAVAEPEDGRFPAERPIGGRALVDQPRKT